MNFFEHRQEMLKRVPDSKYRQTGTSTAIALETISKAITSRNERIEIVNHPPSVMTNRYLSNMIMEIIKKLDLEGFKMRTRGGQFWLVFKLDIEGGQ